MFNFFFYFYFFYSINYFKQEYNFGITVNKSFSYITRFFNYKSFYKFLLYLKKNPFFYSGSLNFNRYFYIFNYDYYLKNDYFIRFFYKNHKFFGISKKNVYHNHFYFLVLLA
uniref:Orf111 n=1 Tax=Acavomonas peruviana TaxID=1542312 RepID=V5KVG6_9ALVE|nr:orf111 [Acavomonas peruviana]